MSFIPLALAALAAGPLDPGPSVHALVVAASAGGEGQSPLAHAVDDARAMQAVLGEVGRVSADRVTRLIDPRPEDVLAAIDAIRSRITSEDAGQSMFVFYYSGHARSDAIDLGKQPLSLDVLRAKLDSVPATVRIVVLDACQSGA